MFRIWHSFIIKNLILLSKAFYEIEISRNFDIYYNIWQLLPNCVFLCHIRVSERIYTQYLPECQETPCSKQARYLKLKWLQGIWTHNHLVHKGTLNHLALQTKWLRFVASTYLYDTFNCMLLLCQVRVSERIYTQ